MNGRRRSAPLPAPRPPPPSASDLPHCLLGSQPSLGAAQLPGWGARPLAARWLRLHSRRPGPLAPGFPRGLLGCSVGPSRPTESAPKCPGCEGLFRGADADGQPAGPRSPSGGALGACSRGRGSEPGAGGSGPAPGPGGAFGSTRYEFQCSLPLGPTRTFIICKHGFRTLFSSRGQPIKYVKSFKSLGKTLKIFFIKEEKQICCVWVFKIYFY